MGHRITPTPLEEAMAIDPVCKMEVDEKTAPAKAEHNGKTFYFCRRDCKEKFEMDPQRYASTTAA